jgi:hypothetical protein
VAERGARRSARPGRRNAPPAMRQGFRVPPLTAQLTRRLTATIFKNAPGRARSGTTGLRIDGAMEAALA